MLVLFSVALLQATVYSSPPSGDTIGYWQQRASYEIAATLDEPDSVLHATGTLTYVNNSPNTLREFYVHQHLNAFRPASAWTVADDREGRVRFQNLQEPGYAYERFTSTPLFDGVPVQPNYPGAPDSTVVRFDLPAPLAPGDTLRVEFAWEARPSTLPRRQGRRGRSYDFAQWYPRVAVYDRGGWQPNPLVPAGEFYGEFGDFDVTLTMRDDQVIGSTGVLVQGDPGWRDALRWGTVAHLAAYDGVDSAAAPAAQPGMKHVRFVARDVHHFAWSVSPDYRYEGAYFLRTAPPRAMPFAVYDSVGIHVLYQPGDEATWGNGQVVARTIVALRWLESIFGPYGYPQMTTLHRIEGGGTEFPMVQMNGSPSQGLILHEGGHIYIHGILANNEWRSGWIDEGLTSYQTSWAQRLTPQEVAQRAVPRRAPAIAEGYRANAVRPTSSFQPVLLDLIGRAEPIGTSAAEFNEFAIYNASIYTRAERMFSALRDVMGDSAFRSFLNSFYARWAFRHVDELAIRTEAARAHGSELDWFFDQWVHETGLVDYALSRVRTRVDGDAWVTTGRVERKGAYSHPMPLGVRTDSGWVVARAEPLVDRQTLTVRTTARPLEVRLDPLGTTGDWYTPNNLDVALPRFDSRTSVVTFDWPFLDQAASDRYVTEFSPLAWYSRPGGVTLAARVRGSYQGIVNRLDMALAASARVPEGRQRDGVGATPARDSRPVSRFQGWLALENPRLFGARPLMGTSAGLWWLDGVALVGVSRRWDQSQFTSIGRRVATTLSFNGTYPYDRNWPDPARWGLRHSSDLSLAHERHDPDRRGTTIRASITAGLESGRVGGDEGTDPYSRGEVAFSWTGGAANSRWTPLVRVYAGGSAHAPRERAVYLSALNPTQTFGNHLWRPDGGVLSLEEVPYTPLGGAGLRGYDPFIRSEAIAALNLEQSVALRRFGQGGRGPVLYASAFADVAYNFHEEQAFPADQDFNDSDPLILRGRKLLGDAGLGLALRGPLFDRDVRFRVDLPLYVSEPELAIGLRDRVEGDEVDPMRLRVTFSFSDLW